jgi:hypothetical protein
MEVELIFEARMITVTFNRKQIRKFQLVGILNRLEAFNSTL